MQENIRKSQNRTLSLAAVYKFPDGPILRAVIGASPVGTDDKFAAPESATPDEHKVFIGRMLDSRRSHVRMKAPEAEKSIFEDLSYSTPTTGPGWADKLMEEREMRNKGFDIHQA
jgi:hypothetical protein